MACVKPGGKLVIDNVALDEIAEWKDETGVKWFLDQLLPSWRVNINTQYPPGIAIVSKPK